MSHFLAINDDGYDGSNVYGIFETFTEASDYIAAGVPDYGAPEHVVSTRHPAGLVSGMDQRVMGANEKAAATYHPNTRFTGGTMTDLGMLKAITERHSSSRQADDAVENVLHVLYETPKAKEMWEPIYDAIKRGYVADPHWIDEDRESSVSGSES